MTIIRCDRCGKRWRGSEDWNATLKDGVIVGALCPDCQTPAENVEAAINEATLDYATDERSRVRGKPKYGN